MDLLNRYINLARVFLEGRGLPFLGAGVSLGAQNASNSDLRPTVVWMIKHVITYALPRLLGDEKRQRQLFAWGCWGNLCRLTTYCGT